MAELLCLTSGSKPNAVSASSRREVAGGGALGGIACALPATLEVEPPA